VSEPKQQPLSRTAGEGGERSEPGEGLRSTIRRWTCLAQNGAQSGLWRDPHPPRALPAAPSPAVRYGIHGFSLVLGEG